MVLLTLAAGCDAEPADTVVPTSPLTVDLKEVRGLRISRTPTSNPVSGRL